MKKDILLFFLLILIGCSSNKSRVSKVKEERKQETTTNNIDTSNLFYKIEPKEAEDKYKELDEEENYKKDTKKIILEEIEEKEKFQKSKVIEYSERKKLEIQTNLTDDILEKTIFRLDEQVKISDIYYLSETLYLIGEDFSASYTIKENNLKKANVIYNPALKFSGIDSLRKELLLYESSRKVVFYDNIQIGVGVDLNEVSSVAVGANKLWVYDKLESFVYILDILKNNGKIEFLPFGKLEYKLSDPLEGLRIKNDVELWGCTNTEIFIFDEYFKIRYRYKLSEEITGITFSETEDTKDYIVIYASSKYENKILKYKLRRK